MCMIKSLGIREKKKEVILEAVSVYANEQSYCYVQGATPTC